MMNVARDLSTLLKGMIPRIREHFTHNITLLSLLILAMIAAPCSMAIGLKVIKSFPETPLAVAKVWDIATYGDNWVFFATQEGLMQYDGSNVTLFHPNNRYALRSVNVDTQSGRVLVGGINEFGYFKPSYTKSLQYVCLSDSLGQDRHIGNIWGIYSANGNIYAQGDTSIIIYDEAQGSYTLVDAKCKLDCSKMIDGVLWLGTDRGLKLLMGKSLIDAPGASILKEKRIRAILPSEGAMLVVTAGNGIYRYNREEATLLEAASKAALSLGDIFSAEIYDNLLALGSIDNGVGILNLSTGELHRYDESSGLPNNTILSVNFDESGNLWTALDPGVVKIQLTAPVETLSNKLLPIGSGYTMAINEGKMYLGTNRGLFYVDYTPGKTLSGLPYHKVEGITGQVWGLSKIGKDLFCSHDRGLFLVKNGIAHRIGDISGIWDVQRAEGRSDKAYAGTYFGLFLLKKSAGEWYVTNQIEGFQGSCYNFVQESPTVIWTDDGEEGIYRLTIDTITNKVTDKQNFRQTSDGIPLTADISLSRIDGRIYFSTPFGLYNYDYKRGNIVKDNKLTALLGHPKQLVRTEREGKWLYAHTGREIIQADPEGKQGIKRISLFLSDMKPPHDGDVIFPLAQQYIAYPTSKGFLFLDFSEANKDSATNDPIIGPMSQIRRLSVTSMADSTVFLNNFLSKKGDIVLRYSENSIKLEFGSSDQSMTGILYSCRLNNGDWSALTSSNIKEYTNLKEGTYHFEVKAVGVDGSETVDAIDFKVLPPWWRTIWAYLGYLVIIGLIVYGIILLEKRRVLRKQAQIAREKDEEIKRQQLNFEWESKLKDHKIVELEKEKLDKELRHKAQEMAGVMINLSHKNETLQTVKRELQNILGLLPRTSADARKAIQDLQGKVSVDMRSDDVIKRVEEEFDIAHNDFIKNLRKRYPDLTNNEVMMCAYIKLNLSTKEIAPLLNISVRGVETMRYRIRKKFNLEREDNLSDFLSRES